jgi:hypothetical protein
LTARTIAECKSTARVARDDEADQGETTGVQQGLVGSRRQGPVSASALSLSMFLRTQAGTGDDVTDGATPARMLSRRGA